MFEKPSYLALLFITIFFLLPEQMYAQEEVFTDSIVTITLDDGTKLVGRIITEDKVNYIIKTSQGLEIKTPKTLVLSIEPLKGRIVNGIFRRFDPNYSRLLYAPTGRPLRKGDGYFSDYYVFFPSVSYGFTDRISVMAGISVFPGVGFSNQLKYIAPKIGIHSTENFALSVGALYFAVDKYGAGIAFIVGTMGQHDKSFTAGLGLGYTKDKDEDLEFAEHPVIMLGGNIRLTNGIALISENWIITGGDFKISEQPLSVVLRFFGDRLAADVGVIIIGEVIDEGFPIPWLSFTYNFGK